MEDLQTVQTSSPTKRASRRPVITMIIIIMSTITIIIIKMILTRAIIIMDKQLLATRGKFGWRKFSKEINLGRTFFSSSYFFHSSFFNHFLSNFKINFSLKSYKPWVPKSSHHLCQTAKVSERHSWQLLCVFRDNFFFGWYDREGRLFQESLSFSLLLVDDFSCFRLKRLDTKSLECFCQVVEKAGSKVVCFSKIFCLRMNWAPCS